MVFSIFTFLTFIRNLIDDYQVWKDLLLVIFIFQYPIADKQKKYLEKYLNVLNTFHVFSI